MSSKKVACFLIALVGLALLVVIAPPPSWMTASSARPTGLSAEHQELLEILGRTLLRGEQPPEGEQVVPLYGVLCTPTDAGFAKDLLRKIDVGVAAYYVIMNGVDRTGSIVPFLRAAQAQFGARKFMFRENAENEGVATGWNHFVTHGFDVLKVNLVVIGNADMHPDPGNMTMFLNFSNSQDAQARCGVAHYLGFALFGLTRYGYEALGTFDENLYPAYGEDVEYVVRALAVSVDRCDGPQQLFYTHFGSPNVQQNSAFQRMVVRARNGQSYLQAKWGFDIFKHTDPITGHYFHPFNDARISIKKWIVDPKMRKCIKGQRDAPCNYDLKGILPKLLAS
ncbi:hypothetical protein DIPPA_07946 [Diplonema papillatum]|nr:hypothetical protein DIPPA_07946 [Diplonema papillatum]